MTMLGDRQPTSLQENADELRRLARGVQLAKDFALYFALCNERQFTLTLMAQIEEVLPPNFALHVSITQPIDDLRALLLKSVEQAKKPPRALFLYGLESWIARDKVIETDMILRINTIRNYFTRSVPYSIVFWIPEYLYLAMLRAAPDFCSIRSGVYRFAPPENEAAAPRATESLLSGDYTALMGTPLAERQERIRDLTELLAEYRSVSEEARDWQAEARLLQRLGDLHLGNGYYQEAEPLYLEGLAIARKSLPQGHPDIATSLNNLAGLYESQGRYGEAEPLYLEGLAIARKSLPQGHPQIATSLNNLAGLYRSQGRYGEAEPLFLEAAQIIRKSLGKQHPNTQIVLNNYLTFLRERNREAEAAAFLKRWNEE